MAFYVFLKFLKFKQRFKYSCWRRTCFILVSGLVQLNINIHSHILIIVKHMLWFLWISVLTTNGGIPQGFGLGDCGNYLSKNGKKKKLIFSHPHFVPIPYAVVFIPVEHEKQFLKNLHKGLFHTVLSITGERTGRLHY